MKDLSREDVLEADDARVTPVDVPEWGGRIYVRAMGGDERDAFEMESARLRAGSDGDRFAGMAGIRARLVARAACDASGKRLFTPADVARLGLKNGQALDRVFDAARELNGMGTEEVAAAGKASATSGPSAEPGSGSPSPTGSP